MSEESSFSPSHVIIAYDATKERGRHELELTVKGVQKRGDILRRGIKLVVLGVLHTVPHPMGYQFKARPDSFPGKSNRAMQEEVSKKVDAYVSMLVQCAEKCEDEGVSIEVKITAGFPVTQVVLQEVVACNASWVILDRHFRRDLRCYLRQTPCKVALIHDSLSVEVLQALGANDADHIEQMDFYSVSKPVPPSDSKVTDHTAPESEMPDLPKVPSMPNQSFDFDYHKQEKPGTSTKGETIQANVSTVVQMQNVFASASQIVHRKRRSFFHQRSSEAPILCSACGTRTELFIQDSTGFSYSDIQLATSEFSKENLLGEGGYGHVYKGELKNGQLIAAKVHKEGSTQGFAEFHSEVFVLSFARHKNIVMLLGYCCKENENILVYEYICNKSLDWHLFDDTETVLDLHRRYTVAIGTAKGLRFLHEECRGCPIIHRDVRPSNILLTHDFVPMLGDFGLAKRKTHDDPLYTRIIGTLGYLAPEYAENGILSVRTDVYAFGIVLLQLISGRKVADAKVEKTQQSLRQWAEPLIENLALHEMIDPRLGKTYDTYELYVMARAAYLCLRISPENRPSMGEVVRLLEGGNDHFHSTGKY